ARCILKRWHDVPEGQLDRPLVAQPQLAKLVVAAVIAHPPGLRLGVAAEVEIPGVGLARALVVGGRELPGDLVLRGRQLRALLRRVALALRGECSGRKQRQQRRACGVETGAYHLSPITYHRRARNDRSSARTSGTMKSMCGTATPASRAKACVCPS